MFLLKFKNLKYQTSSINLCLMTYHKQKSLVLHRKKLDKHQDCLTWEKGAKHYHKCHRIWQKYICKNTYIQNLTRKKYINTKYVPHSRFFWFMFWLCLNVSGLQANFIIRPDSTLPTTLRSDKCQMCSIKKSFKYELFYNMTIMVKDL